MTRVFQSPMGIVSAAKGNGHSGRLSRAAVSIPDGDSFRREAKKCPGLAHTAVVSIPDGDSFRREGQEHVGYCRYDTVSIPDGDSFRREVNHNDFASSVDRAFQSPMGIVSAAKPLPRIDRRIG